MEIIKGIEIIDLGLYFRKEKIFVISDIHVGYEEALNKQGILMPRFHANDILKRLDMMFKDLEINAIIINGDLKHEFGSISEQEWRDSLKVIDFFIKKAKKVVLVKGNHDKILEPIANKRNLEIVEEFILGDTIIIHGDTIPKTIGFSASKKIIIGHEHPAISIKEGNRVEKFKCFLKGKYKNQTLIVLPSCNLVTEGTDIITEKVLSPFLKQDLSNFDVFVIGEQVYEFGKLKNFK